MTFLRAPSVSSVSSVLNLPGGHGFSRAVEAPFERAALAAEGFFACITLLAVFAMTSCAQAKTEKPEADLSAAHQERTAPAPPAGSHASAPRIDPQRALRYTRQVVAFGSRPPGSPAHRKLQDYIRTQLKGDRLEEDAFTASTPQGRVPMRNLIAKYPGSKDGVIVIAGHYDTKPGLKNFVGANDGGSSTALLLELADHLRGKKREGYSVWLVWLDGEEAYVDFTETDGLYGSRHLAERWKNDGTLPLIKALIVADMVGDADLNIEREEYSTTWLRDLVYQAALNLGYHSHFFGRSMAVVDDHVPFLRAGVPAIDLIDFHYGYGNTHWHTPQDTLDKLSPRSFEIVGNTILESIRLLDQK